MASRAATSGAVRGKKITPGMQIDAQFLRVYLGVKAKEWTSTSSIEEQETKLNAVIAALLPAMRFKIKKSGAKSGLKDGSRSVYIVCNRKAFSESTVARASAQKKAEAELGAYDRSPSKIAAAHEPKSVCKWRFMYRVHPERGVMLVDHPSALTGRPEDECAHLGHTHVSHDKAIAERQLRGEPLKPTTAAEKSGNSDDDAAAMSSSAAGGSAAPPLAAAATAADAPVTGVAGDALALAAAEAARVAARHVERAGEQRFGQKDVTADLIDDVVGVLSKIDETQGLTQSAAKEQYSAIFKRLHAKHHPTVDWDESVYQAYMRATKMVRDQRGESPTAVAQALATDVENAKEMVEADDEFCFKRFCVGIKQTHFIVLHKPTIEIVGSFYPDFVSLDDTQAKLVWINDKLFVLVTALPTGSLGIVGWMLSDGGKIEDVKLFLREVKNAMPLVEHDGKLVRATFGAVLLDGAQALHTATREELPSAMLLSCEYHMDEIFERLCKNPYDASFKNVEARKRACAAVSSVIGSPSLAHVNAVLENANVGRLLGPNRINFLRDHLEMWTLAVPEAAVFSAGRTSSQLAEVTFAWLLKESDKLAKRRNMLVSEVTEHFMSLAKSKIKEFKTAVARPRVPHNVDPEISGIIKELQLPKKSGLTGILTILICALAELRDPNGGYTAFAVDPSLELIKERFRNYAIADHAEISLPLRQPASATAYIFTDADASPLITVLVGVVSANGRKRMAAIAKKLRSKTLTDEKHAKLRRQHDAVRRTSTELIFFEHDLAVDCVEAFEGGVIRCTCLFDIRCGAPCVHLLYYILFIHPRAKLGSAALGVPLQFINSFWYRETAVAAVHSLDPALPIRGAHALLAAPETEETEETIVGPLDDNADDDDDDDVVRVEEDDVATAAAGESNADTKAQQQDNDHDHDDRDHDDDYESDAKGRAMDEDDDSATSSSEEEEDSDDVSPATSKKLTAWLKGSNDEMKAEFFRVMEKVVNRAPMVAGDAFRIVGDALRQAERLADHDIDLARNEKERKNRSMANEMGDAAAIDASRNAANHAVGSSSTTFLTRSGKPIKVVGGGTSSSFADAMTRRKKPRGRRPRSGVEKAKAAAAAGRQLSAKGKSAKRKKAANSAKSKRGKKKAKK